MCTQKAMNFPFKTNDKLIFLGGLILKHFRLSFYMHIISGHTVFYTISEETLINAISP